MSADKSMLERWGRAAVHHRWKVIGAWAILLVVLAVVAKNLSEGTTSGLSVPGAESQNAVDVLEASFPERAGDYGDVVIKADAGLDDPAARATVDKLVADLSQVPGVVSVASPYTPNLGLISADGTIGIARVQFADSADDVSSETADAVIGIAESARNDSLQVEFGGPVASAQEHEGPNESTVLGIMAALVILYILFRTLVPTILPIGTAMLGLAAGFTIIFSLTAAVDLSKFAPNIAAMLGLGVGVDYALFIVARHRENVSRGMNIADSVALTLATSGKSVIFAGGVVVTSLLGLSFMGIPFVGWLGVAAAVMVTLAVLVAVTLLPALLGVAGTRILSLRAPVAGGACGEAHHRSPWYRLGFAIMRRPYLYFGASAAILIVLAIPAFSIRLGSADAGNNPTSSSTRRAYDLVAEGFGEGANGPLQIVVEGGSSEATTALRTAIAADANVAAVSQPIASSDGTLTVFSVIPKTEPQAQETTDLVHRLRDETIPSVSEGSDAEVYVAGTTARYVDISDRIASRLPLFFSIVIGV
ncbi:MAG TPA: MMPL family transporter, partial [Tepidiformaceae bacterium]|nr:MMPL family transporter [Tepidiformaceae bacterium]